MCGAYQGADVFIVGENGVILHYNGTAWSTMTSPTTLTLQGVWGTAANNVFAVGGPSASSGGDRGTILKYDGGAWIRVWNDPSILRFHDLWGSSDTNLFAVGEAGAIVHSANGGTSWEVMDNPVKGSTVTLRDIWGSSASDIFAVGDGDSTADYGSTILHYDGSAWSIMANPRSATSTKLHGVWGSSFDNVFAVGDRYIEPDGITTHGTIYALYRASALILPTSSTSFINHRPCRADHQQLKLVQQFKFLYHHGAADSSQLHQPPAPTTSSSSSSSSSS